MSAPDRTLGEDADEVLFPGRTDAYHRVVREDPLMTSCSLTPDPLSVDTTPENVALRMNLRRCKDCEWDDELVVYVAGSKRYHERDGGGSACSAVGSIDALQHAAVQPEHRMEANGIERCPDCWAGGEMTDNDPTETETL